MKTLWIDDEHHALYIGWNGYKNGDKIHHYAIIHAPTAKQLGIIHVKNGQSMHDVAEDFLK